MTDLYFEDYDRETREDSPGEFCRAIGILCVIIIGFTLFFMVYSFIWEQMISSMSFHGLELATLGLVFAVIIFVYVVRNKSLEKRKRMAAS